MTEREKAPEEVVLTRLLRLNAVVHGVVAGIGVGHGVFIATNWLLLPGGEGGGPHSPPLGQFFIGYRTTFVGSLIGFVYGFFCGFIGGYFIARMYNWLVDLREGKNQRHGGEIGYERRRVATVPPRAQ